MISDSPYNLDDLVLSPLGGILAGLFAAFVMLSVVVVLQPYSGISVEQILGQYARFVLPERFENMQATTLLGIGLGVHLLIRVLLALLYSVCQQTAPTRGLVAVGIFYGFIIWMTGSVLFGMFFYDEWKVTGRSWTWLFANLLFGICLAATAIIAEKIRPSAVVALPKD